ncbi:hypothetical protein [Wenyingzhuangia sp. 2_MG-2023]|uniref:hypothetical protein n=1 Tax=Wenyingzhuangia sp. 2_MG-2023 TaxID=3062639 RepID=UPI0026E26BE2|nr:hypothetical protein [Wenyingzhuangia sp. 2_MG-2023]MDO6737682.1 hypothetical protein [Wenyingzhuangia sp. 2_MG-2023]
MPFISEDEFIEFNDKIESLEQECSKLKEQISSLEEERLTMENQVSTLKHKNLDLETQISALGKELVTVEDKLTSLQSECIGLEELKQDHVEKIKTKNNQLKAAVVVGVLLMLICLGGTYAFFNGKKDAGATKVAATAVKTEETVKTPKPIVEQDSKEIAQTDVVTYGVQIGVYKDLDIHFTSEVQKIKKDGLNHYVLGNFPTFEEAKYLRIVLYDLKLRDVVIVKLMNGEIIE